MFRQVLIVYVLRMIFERIEIYKSTRTKVTLFGEEVNIIIIALVRSYPRKTVLLRKPSGRSKSH